MAQSNFISRPIIAQATMQPIGMARPRATTPANAMPWKPMAYTLVVFALIFGAVAYPLSIAGGFLAKSRGNIVAIDAAAQTLTIEENGRMATIVVQDTTQLSGHVVALDKLEVGDRVVVKYDSVFKGSALEIVTIRNLSR